MRVRLSQSDCAQFRVDRSGRLEDHGRQGFDVGVGGVVVEFEDELDAERIARAVLARLGVEVAAPVEAR
jgi:hypothetical protein